MKKDVKIMEYINIPSTISADYVDSLVLKNIKLIVNKKLGNSCELSKFIPEFIKFSKYCEPTQKALFEYSCDLEGGGVLSTKEQSGEFTLRRFHFIAHLSYFHTEKSLTFSFFKAIEVSIEGITLNRRQVLENNEVPEDDF